MILTHRIALSRRPLAMTMAGAFALPFGAAPLSAQTLDLSVTLPRLDVAEYHKPYVAIWLEQEGAAPRTLGIWYDVAKKGGEGAKWLRDVRQWWRAAGRSMRLPADGVSGATRGPGTHRLTLSAGRGPLPPLAPGQYVLVIEAAREVGGRELLRLPFAWPGTGGTASARAAGTTELGAVALTVRR